MPVKLKTADKFDNNVLSALFFDSLELNGNPIKKFLLQFIVRNAFIRKRLFEKVNKSILDSWEKIQYSLVLFEEQTIGFAMVTWRQGNEKESGYATIQEIYLKPVFRGKKIERIIIEEISKYWLDKNFRLGFSHKPEWNLSE